MKDQLALIMALPSESKGLFEQAGITVHYSGIGKVNAAFKVATESPATKSAELYVYVKAGFGSP